MGELVKSEGSGLVSLLHGKGGLAIAWLGYGNVKNIIGTFNG